MDTLLLLVATKARTVGERALRILLEGFLVIIYVRWSDSSLIFRIQVSITQNFRKHLGWQD